MADTRLHIAVNNRRNGAFVLADNRPDIRGAVHMELRGQAVNQGFDPMFVGRIAVGIDQANHQAIDPNRSRLLDRRHHTFNIDRNIHRTIGAHALPHGKNTIFRDQRVRTFGVQIIGIRHFK